MSDDINSVILSLMDNLHGKLSNAVCVQAFNKLTTDSLEQIYSSKELVIAIYPINNPINNPITYCQLYYAFCSTLHHVIDSETDSETDSEIDELDCSEEIINLLLNEITDIVDIDDIDCNVFIIIIMKMRELLFKLFHKFHNSI
jgi:hypothetical protein